MKFWSQLALRANLGSDPCEGHYPTIRTVNQSEVGII